MRRYFILLMIGLICLSCILSSCKIFGMDDYIGLFLCKVNANGTGFKKLVEGDQLPYIDSSLHITKDGRLILQSSRNYITNPDSLNWISFAETNIGRMEFSNDNKMYYCKAGDLYQYDLTTNATVNLTADYDGYLVGPRLSFDDSCITMTKEDNDGYPNYGKLCIYRFSDQTITVVPQINERPYKGIYVPAMDKIYYQWSNSMHDSYCGLYSINLDGTQKTQVLSYQHGVNNISEITSQGDCIVVLDASNILKIYHVLDGTCKNFQLDYAGLPVVCPKNSPRVYYTKEGSIYYYETVNQSTVKVRNAPSAWATMCPTWDGSTIYYISNFRVTGDEEW